MNRRLPVKTLLLAACTVFAASFSSVSMAQSAAYPSGHTIKVVVPYSPGGAVDFVGRAMAQRLGEVMGVPVVVDNRPGAGGMIGAQFVAQSAPDGLTLLVIDPSVVINPALQANLPFQLKDLRPVSLLTASPLVLSVNAQLPITDIPSLLAYAKANPDKVSFASAGVGTTPHMAGELLALRSGVPLTHVPYKGSGPAMADLMAGHVQMAFSTIAAAGPAVKDGRIRAIATSGPMRPPAFGNVSTVAESGIKNFEVLFWTGLFVPAGTPDAIVQKLNAEAKKVLTASATIEALEKSGEVAGYTSTADSAAFVKSESDKWSQVIKTAKITP